MTESNGIDYKARCQEKVCKDCGETKPISDFPFVATRNRYIPRCRICHNKRAGEYANSREPEVKEKRGHTQKRIIKGT